MVTGVERSPRPEWNSDEIEVIAEHEHVLPGAAFEIGCAMASTDLGVRMFRRYLYLSTERALLSGQFEKASRLARLFDSPRWARRPPTGAVPGIADADTPSVLPDCAMSAR